MPVNLDSTACLVLNREYLTILQEIFIRILQRILVYLPTHDFVSLYQWVFFYTLYLSELGIRVFFPPSKCHRVRLCVICVSGVDRFIEHGPARQHSPLAASERAEREHWAQQSPPCGSRPVRVWVRSGSWSGTWPRLYVSAWDGACARYGTGPCTRTGRRGSWFT